MVDGETGSRAPGVYTLEGEFCLMAELQRAVKSHRESLGCFSLKYSVLQFWGAVKDEKCYPAASRITAIVMLMHQQWLAVHVS